MQNHISAFFRVQKVDEVLKVPEVKMVSPELKDHQVQQENLVNQATQVQKVLLVKTQLQEAKENPDQKEVQGHQE